MRKGKFLEVGEVCQSYCTVGTFDIALDLIAGMSQGEFREVGGTCKSCCTVETFDITLDLIVGLRKGDFFLKKVKHVKATVLWEPL